MRTRVRTWAFLASWAVVGAAGAQTIDLAVGGANPIWRGTTAGGRAGRTLDHGTVSAGDGRKDLIIGAPGGPGVVGAVFVLFGGPAWTGDLPLSLVNTIVGGGAAGDLFGAALAVGDILNVEGTNLKALAVGAPGAHGGRGAVYVFTTGFVGGDTYTTTDAAARIVGAAGDRLGASLATADLNNDGYREIVIGAPGTGRIYVIGGGPTLAGTIIDLSVTPAAITFTYPGLGVLVAAGDVTGDGIYDMLAGHPAFNSVHVLKGRNGSMPPAAFDMTFGGIDAGDGVGTSIRLADVDADRTSDIILGAPDGDGPSNGRPGAGEAYLIWGGPTIAGRSLQFADVTFFGAVPGARMGGMLAGGDINRDTPNDLVFVAHGARGGAGAIDIYYGRERRHIGVPRGDGPRIVDFASEPPDRSILGDTAGGTITAAQVYEVTGEGARDVIVGMADNGGGVGAVYFTISPRLVLGTSNMALSGLQGIVSSSPVLVSNISSIPITWRTSSDRGWLSATATGSTSASTPGNLVVIANGQGLAPGTHTGMITVTSTSSHLLMSQNIAVAFVVRETQPSPAAPPAGGMPPGALYNLFWRHRTEGWLALWHMNGVTLTGTSSLSVNHMADTTWRIMGVGDVNGDGHNDVVWQHDDGWLAAWYLHGTQVILTSYLSINRMPDPNWRIRGIADTNGDRRADLLWQHAGDGRLAVWFMNGVQVVSTSMLSMRMTAANWLIRAAGDTNGDGRAEIVWHKADTGELAIWALEGATVTGTSRLSIRSVADLNWQIVGSEDVNGDRRADILWQHADGSIAAWYMDGPTVAGTTLMNPSRASSVNWRIVGPR